MTIGLLVWIATIHEPRHDKTNRLSVRQAKTQISLGIRPVWSESSLSTWRKLRSLATHWAHNEDSDQTGRMPRLIWVFAGRTLTLLVLSCRGSYMYHKMQDLISSTMLQLCFISKCAAICMYCQLLYMAVCLSGFHTSVSLKSELVEYLLY